MSVCFRRVPTNPQEENIDVTLVYCINSYIILDIFTIYAYISFSLEFCNMFPNNVSCMTGLTDS